MTDDKYTIDPLDYSGIFGSLIVGDCIDMLTGAIVVGPFCEWPKREPRRLTVTVHGDWPTIDAKQYIPKDKIKSELIYKREDWNRKKKK